MSLLRRIEKSLDSRMRSVFAGGNAESGGREAVELYRDALDQIAGRATPGKRGDKLLPFNLITIELRADTPDRKAALEAIFEPKQFSDDVEATLKAERVTPPADLTVAIRFPPEAEEEMRVILEKTEKPVPGSGPVTMLPACLITVTGTASIPVCYLDRLCVNLGRVEDVSDPAGRTIRHNELFFPDAAHEANSTVSRSHAHIAFDPAAGVWRIFDDGSSIGTTIFRAGKRVDIPPHASRGVALKSGDEIYLGQVRLRYELI
jgi:hypothetical protein